ncbi:uncharacterized protein TRIADDRAFT_54064 [Trichoplax adhaerens]|uniref:5-formyltetrahydrofolate cyclo-ligase n=1 Tax=Trichoplax adhaerens TaxID=10228 RepID=B3RR04_TRIAD|nr:hypothetical protein TRIADDRAFT_54064 [Trichoplax adhaerens]EDV26793.1 hypothetical protein TRIADDRAFT_54064 [Trichoplax adhaerens]|eukprot:XP_002110789.1 hypothetical protein TRIADDRAFT_54064 [Trichoplax adhaerens]
MASRNGVRAAKNLLRKTIKQRVALISDIQKDRESLQVAKKLMATPEYQKSKRVCVYLHMDDEIRTTAILKDIFSTNKICYIPHYYGPIMDMVRLHSWEDYDNLPLTSWNIKQPADNEQRENAISGGGLDLIIVPGLGFTMAGDRLGRGKGYYDGYLQKYEEKLHKRPITIALAFASQICDTIPTDDHDRRIDMVISGNSTD